MAPPVRSDQLDVRRMIKEAGAGAGAGDYSLSYSQARMSPRRVDPSTRACLIIY